MFCFKWNTNFFFFNFHSSLHNLSREEEKNYSKEANCYMLALKRDLFASCNCNPMINCLPGHARQMVKAKIMLWYCLHKTLQYALLFAHGLKEERVKLLHEIFGAFGSNERKDKIRRDNIKVLRSMRWNVFFWLRKYCESNNYANLTKRMRFQLNNNLRQTFLNEEHFP